MTVIGLRLAAERQGTLILILGLTARLLRALQMVKTNGLPLTKAIEIQHGDQETSSTCPKRALNVHVPSIHIRIAITQTIMTQSPGSVSSEDPNP